VIVTQSIVVYFILSFHKHSAFVTDGAIAYPDRLIIKIKKSVISMNKAFLNITILCIIAVIFSSCATYLIPVADLRAQFAGIDSTNLVDVVVRGPVGERYHYLANPLRTIYCADKKNNPKVLINSPSIEMRITNRENEKTIFYFDRIFVSETTLYGVQSRFIPSIAKRIPLNEIKKIEVQDGKKNFRYIAH